MASTLPVPTVFSQAVQSIVNIKSAELHKKHELYRSRLNGLFNTSSEQDAYEIINKAYAVIDLKLPFADTDDFDNIVRFLKGAKYDNSVSETQLSRYNTKLHSLVEQQNSRLNYAKLYSAILNQHLHPAPATADSDTTLEKSSLDSSFEMLEHDRLEQLRQKFESVVFASIEADGKELSDYLHSLFSTEGLGTTLKTIRSNLERSANRIWNHTSPFDSDMVHWILEALIKNSLLKDEKKKLLKSFQNDPLLIEEICDVLNMRWLELSNWCWTHDGKGLNVEPRRQLNGKYRVVADEDVLDAILLHHLGVNLCAASKGILQTNLEEVLMPYHNDNCYGISQFDIDKRQFYQNDSESPTTFCNLQQILNNAFSEEFFLSHLPRTVRDEVDYDEDEEGEDGKKSMVDLKQQLLRHIATEVKMRLHTSGDIAVVQTDLQWFGTSIPHNTILTVLRFLGLPEQWFQFFNTYLKTPLNMGKADGDDKMRTRTCGMPMGQVMERFLGEMVLLCMDIAVKRESGVLLYRMHDDIFFYGTVKQCEKAWAALQKFVKSAGLEFNTKKTGSVCIPKAPAKTKLPGGDVTFDFLRLSSNGSWKIDATSVGAHTRQLRKQLLECKDILSFIRTYNSCIGRFFGHTFGLPAHCFGQEHIDEILQVHRRMQQELFGSSGISGVLKLKLKQLAQEESLEIAPSDSFIFTPVSFGGLGVANPFIPLLLKYNDLQNSPDQLIQNFLAKEKRRYAILKQNFEQEYTSKRKGRYSRLFKNYEDENLTRELVSVNEFFSFEEYIKDREMCSRGWQELYEELTSQPGVNNVKLTSDVKACLGRMPSGMRESKLADVEKYILQLFSDELFEHFGTLQILDRSLVPIGVVEAILKEKVTWQMVL